MFLTESCGRWTIRPSTIDRLVIDAIEIDQQLAAVRQAAERIGERNPAVLVAELFGFGLAVAQITLRPDQLREIEIVAVGDDHHPQPDAAQHHGLDQHSAVIDHAEEDDEARA